VIILANIGAGRPKGALNRKTKEFQALLNERGFSVGEAYLELFDEALKQYKKTDSFDPHASGVFLKILFDITKEIAAHSLPKLKAIETAEDAPLEHLTEEEKLAVAKNYVAQLESKIEEK
jgi:hypothetical protein